MKLPDLDDDEIEVLVAASLEQGMGTSVTIYQGALLRKDASEQLSYFTLLVLHDTSETRYAAHAAKVVRFSTRDENDAFRERVLASVIDNIVETAWSEMPCKRSKNDLN